MPVIKVLKHYVQRDAFEIATQFTLLTLLFAQVGNAFTRPFILLIAAISIVTIIDGHFRVTVHAVIIYR